MVTVPRGVVQRCHVRHYSSLKTTVAHTGRPFSDSYSTRLKLAHIHCHGIVFLHLECKLGEQPARGTTRCCPTPSHTQTNHLRGLAPLHFLLYFSRGRVKSAVFHAHVLLGGEFAYGRCSCLPTPYLHVPPSWLCMLECECGMAGVLPGLAAGTGAVFSAFVFPSPFLRFHRSLCADWLRTSLATQASIPLLSTLPMPMPWYVSLDAQS